MGEELSTIAVNFGPEQLASKQAEATMAQQETERYAIVSTDSLAFAVGWLREVKIEREAVEAMRISATSPLNAALRTVNSWFRPVLDALAAAEVTLKGRIAGYQRQEAERQTLALLAAAEAHRQGDHETARTELVTANAAASGARAPAGVTTRWVWHARIDDAPKVPREWCVPDEKRIAAMARATPSDSQPVAISGVVFTREPSVTARKVRE